MTESILETVNAVGQWLGATDAPVDVIAAQERVSEDVERLLAELAEEREWRIRLQQSEEREHNRFLAVAEAAREFYKEWAERGYVMRRERTRLAAALDLAALTPGGDTAPQKEETHEQG